MCLLYFSLLKTVPDWGSKEVQKDGRGCVEVSCMATPGIWRPRTTPQLVFDSIIRGAGENFLEAEGYLSIPFLCPSPAGWGEPPRTLLSNPAPKSM